MRRFPAIALFGALLLSPLAARAADEDNVAEAKALLAEGLRLFKNGDFEHARLKFAAGRGLVKSDDLLWNLAIAEAKSGHLAEAVNHFREYEREPKARAGDVKEADTRWLPALLPQVGQLAIDGTAGTRVRVDLQDAGALPLGGTWAVMPGGHHVEGDAGAGAKDVTVAAGQIVNVHLGSDAVAVVAVPPPAPVQQALASGPAAVAPDTTSHSGTSGARIGVTVGLGVVAVGALAGGIAFGAASKSKANDAQSLASGLGACPASAGCATLKSDYDSENHDHTASTIFYVGAGVFAVGALATWFLWPQSSESRSAVVPMMGPGVAGARWVTTF